MPRRDPKARKADTTYRTLEDRRGRQLYRMAMWWMANGDRDVMTYMRDAIREWLAEDKHAGRPRPKYPEREIELTGATVLARIWAAKREADRADKKMKWAYGCRPKNI